MPAPQRVTEKKRIDVEFCTPQNPVCLKWINLLGGWDYWVFGKTQTIVQNSEILSDVLRPIDDLENSDTYSDVVSRSAVEKWILGVSQAPVVKVRGLRGLLKSPKVMLLVSQSPEQWQTVRVLGGDFPVEETLYQFYDLEVQIQLQPQFIQSQ